MGSVGERPDLDALHELEEVLKHLADELAAWRRRALSAESRVADHSRASGGDGPHRLRELRERHIQIDHYRNSLANSRALVRSSTVAETMISLASSALRQTRTSPRPYFRLKGSMYLSNVRFHWA